MKQRTKLARLGQFAGASEDFPMMVTKLTRKQRKKSEYPGIGGTAKGEWGQRMISPPQAADCVPSVPLHDLEGVVQDAISHCVINDIPPLCVRRECDIFLWFLGLVVYRNGAIALHDRCLAGRYCRVNSCSKAHAKLNGHVANAASATVDKDSLPGLNVRSIDEPFPCCEDRKRHCSSFNHREVSGLTRHQRCVGNHIFRKRTLDPGNTAGHPINLIPFSQMPYIWPDFLCSSGEVEPQDGRRRVPRMGCFTSSDFGIQRIHSAR